jgi:hypothetical protein
LPAPQFFRGKIGAAVCWQRDTYERPKKRREFTRVEADQPQCALKIGEALLTGTIRAKSQSTPFSDWM